MKLVSSQTKEERDKVLRDREREEKEGWVFYKKYEVQRALRELTANLVRVTRGAGRAHSIPSQLLNCVEAFQNHRLAAGLELGDSEIADMLSIQLDYDPERSDPEQAQVMVMRGALQIAASRLARQPTQERSGQRELMDGIKELQVVREEQRR